MPLYEAKSEIPPEAVGSAEEILLALGLESWSLLEDAIARRAWIVGIVRDEGEAREEWAEIRALLALSPEPPMGIRAIADSDWRDSYKAHFHAWTFGRLHWVPVWEKEGFVLPPGHAVLWLDPGMAFGTGNHETTRLCIERLVELPAAGKSVLDAGAGSGILALSARLLGFGPVSGFDIDPEAVRVSVENAGMNGLAGEVAFAASGLEEGLREAAADVVLANIQADVLKAHALHLIAAVSPGGTLVLSGILASENAEVKEAFGRAASGWRIDSRVLGEWSDLCLTRPPAEAP